MSALSYYMVRFWEDSGDARVSSLPLMHGGPWSLLVLSAIYLYGISTAIPNWIKVQRKSNLNFDARPWLIVYYGFMFGIHGVGALLHFAVLDLSSTWSCEPLNAAANDARSMGILYAAYILFAIKLIGLLEPFLALVEQRATKSQTGNALAILANIFLYRFAYKSVPGHSFLWIALTEMMFCSFNAGYQVLVCSSSELRPGAGWKRSLITARFLHLLSLFLHGFHLITTPSCSMPMYVSFFECLYSLFSMSFLTLSLVNEFVASNEPGSRTTFIAKSQ